MMECESVLIAWRPNRVNENKKKKKTVRGDKYSDQ